MVKGEILFRKSKNRIIRSLRVKHNIYLSCVALCRHQARIILQRRRVTSNEQRFRGFIKTQRTTWKQKIAKKTRHNCANHARDQSENNEESNFRFFQANTQRERIPFRQLQLLYTVKRHQFKGLEPPHQVFNFAEKKKRTKARIIWKVWNYSRRIR